MSAVVIPMSAPLAGNRVPLGQHESGTLDLDLDRLLAGRLLIQGSSGAGKSRTLRKIVEEAFDYVTVMIVDPEGDFGNLAEHIGATTIRATELTTEGLTAAAARGREHRLPLHLDLTDLDPDERITRAAAFFAGLIGAPREHWCNTVMVAIDEAHLLAPHVAGSARDAETRRLGVATLTDLCSRGRKRGIAPVIATQRLAKLATSVVSELLNFLVGQNVFDRDIARAADLLGFDSKRADLLRSLAPGEFFAFGPALCREPMLVKIDVTITEHLGATPDLIEASGLTGDEAHKLLALDDLRETVAPRDAHLVLKGTRLLDAFLMDPAASAATRIVEALRRIAPNATTACDLAGHLALDREQIDSALDMLAGISAVDTMPRGENRIARLHARLRQRASDIPVVAL
ncbi:hypothetical protein BH10PSE14_BH10PSE14_04730 [soil metagenome]